MLQKIYKIITSLTFLLILIKCNLSLQEYQQVEKQAPDVIFELRSQKDDKQYTSKLQKLIFITPWNQIGSQLVIKYAKKFDYVSPCWYDLTFKKQHILIENSNNFNLTFIKMLKKANPDIKILPRVYISSNQQALIQHIGSVQSNFKQAVHLVSTLINNLEIDGLVWDTPFNTLIKQQRNLQLNQLILQLVNSIKLNLQPSKLIFYNMANPMNYQLSQLYSILNVDRILIQNYDNNQYIQMIQNSITWIKSAPTQQKIKFILLLPFFSRRQGQGINTKQVERALERQGIGSSAISNDICTFMESKTRIISYVPCYAYFKKAFKMIEQQHHSVGFWEAGNGLQNYYQFL